MEVLKVPYIFGYMPVHCFKCACLCVFVYVCERESERERGCVCLSVCIYRSMYATLVYIREVIIRHYFFNFSPLNLFYTELNLKHFSSTYSLQDEQCKNV